MVKYIIDTYNKYAANDNVRHTFRHNDRTYCVREVRLDKNGEPDFPEKDFEAIEGQYYLYDSLEEVMQYITDLRLGAGFKFIWDT